MKRRSLFGALLAAAAAPLAVQAQPVPAVRKGWKFVMFENGSTINFNDLMRSVDQHGPDGPAYASHSHGVSDPGHSHNIAWEGWIDRKDGTRALLR